MSRRSTSDPVIVQTATSLRREISARNLALAGDADHEVTYGSVASVLYREDEDGAHGNFYPAAYRRILTKPDWARRLDKVYTASSRIVRGYERQRSELDCAISSDALLMNIFCAPGTVRSARLCSLLGIEPGLQPEFGVRVRTPLRGDLDDRTEVDMQLGDLLVEAKLGESGFQTARADLLARYHEFEAVFDTEHLPRVRGQFRSYQLLRGVMAAVHHQARFAVFCDARRPDLREDWFQVLACVQSADLRSRMLLITWQEIAACLSRPLQQFLGEKYGVFKADSSLR
ncbi:MAG: PGN_0703 family putative restriction endonuclease [Janthinobacterium lividum]